MSASRGLPWPRAGSTGSRWPAGTPCRPTGWETGRVATWTCSPAWQRRGEFPELAAAVIAALESAGYKASVIMSAETFTRLILTDPADGSEEKVELSVDWRAHEPVQLDVGPVLHADDAVANKVCALFGRALPRDFLDVDAAVMSGRYTREQLLELAAEADRGFDRLLFADALGTLTQITDTAFAEYRTDPAAVADMRHRFARWRSELLTAGRS
jgi:hypothetical protein